MNEKIISSLYEIEEKAEQVVMDYKEQEVQIKKEYDIKINYELTLKNYPVYYARSEKENSQNYVVVGENNEKFNGVINTKIGAGKSTINSD